jgi:hypothetical protein
MRRPSQDHTVVKTVWNAPSLPKPMKQGSLKETIIFPKGGRAPEFPEDERRQPASALIIAHWSIIPAETGGGRNQRQNRLRDVRMG